MAEHLPHTDVEHMLRSTTRTDATPPQELTLPAYSALDTVRGPADELLDRFLGAQVHALAELDPQLAEVGSEVARFITAGGKRLRPAFTYWGHRATGAPHDEAVVAVGCAVELLHAFALVHDDVMDRSEERRGHPTVHVAMREAHRREGLRGDAGWFGVGAAILAGDIVFVWADRLLEEADLTPEAAARARAVFTELRVEVMAGQFLDLRLSTRPHVDVDEALRVALLKSGRYTVTRPLQLGAAVAGGDDVTVAALAAYGDAVGVAFQLRDDVLGLFGDPATTGKAAHDDLREGKRTVLMLTALARASASARTELERLLGNPEVCADDADRARDVIIECGALAEVEGLLAERKERARRALAPIPAPAREALEELADLAAFRTL